MINFNDLILNKVYIVDGRNFDIAMFTKEGFEGVRNKFGRTYIDIEDHWDDNGTVQVIREATETEILEFIDEIQDLED